MNSSINTLSPVSQTRPVYQKSTRPNTLISSCTSRGVTLQDLKKITHHQLNITSIWSSLSGGIDQRWWLARSDPARPLGGPSSSGRGSKWVWPTGGFERLWWTLYGSGDFQDHRRSSQGGSWNWSIADESPPLDHQAPPLADLHRSCTHATRWENTSGSTLFKDSMAIPVSPPPCKSPREAD